MDYQSLYAKTVVDLRRLARDMGVRLPAGAKKQLLVELLLEADARQEAERRAARQAAGADASAKDGTAPVAAPKPAEAGGTGGKPDAVKQKAGKGGEKPDPVKPTPRKRGRPSKAEMAARAAAAAFQGDSAAAEELASPESAKMKPSAAAPIGAGAPREGQESPRPGAPQEAAAPQERGGRGGAGDGQRRGIGAQARPVGQRYVSGGAPAGRETAPHLRRVPDGNRFAPRQDGRPMQHTVSARPAQVNRPRPALRPEGAEPAQRERPTQENRIPRANGPENRPAVPQELLARPAQERQGAPVEGEARARREGYYSAEYRTGNPAVPELIAAGDCGEGAGVLEIQPDGYGFLRAENCQKGPNDVYISIAQIRRFNLRQGDHVEGKTRPQREGDRYSAILYITKVNGEDPEKAAQRPRFEDLVPIYPEERIRLERPENEDMSLRLVDMLAPIGKGQRGMIVSPPKAGKTTLLKKIANAITATHPEIHLIVLLIDERPEEVTDMKRSIDGEVVYSTFDQPPENHTQVSEMVLERAQRLVEMGKDVVVLMDSITRLARAYNLVIAPTGRSLSGGLDPGALFRPKRFFGAARNIEHGGSLTIIATALVDTGSRMDDIIYEEFKGTGNMELHLDRKLSDRRVFPAVDMMRSGTRREELLLTEAEQAGALKVRRMLGSGRDQEMVEQVIEVMAKTRNNANFFDILKGWDAVAGKQGYAPGK